MSSQGFSFPPPPPPPPPSTQHHSAYPSAQHGHWNGRAGRSRGRGHGNRGRGGHFSSEAGRTYPTPSLSPSGYNHTPTNYGYPPAQPVTAASYMPPPPYAHTQSTFQHPQTPHTYQTPQPYTQPAGSASYHPLPGYNGPLPPTTPFTTQPAPYPSPIPPPQHGSPPPNTPVMMGSGHWGEQNVPYGAPPGHGRGPRPPHPHGNHGPKSRHPHKRDHSAAFNKPQSTVPRTPAPPSVPSFGNPLPCKPPPAADATRKPKKRKRKHNLLGLTPKTEEHESSEEEEEVDEESKLASNDGTLQFTYKGQTATLQTASDIASWIAERKKKFPTAARIEEKKKAGEEAKAARDVLRREKEKAKHQEKQERLEKQGKQGKSKDEKEQEQEQEQGRKLSDVQADPAIDAAMKAQRKADKIRRNLDREQKRFAKAEAEAEAARLKVAALQKQVMGLGSDSSPVDGAPESEGHPATCNGGGGDNTSTATAAAPTEAATAEALTAETTVETMDADLQADSVPLSVEALLKASADGLGEPGEAMDIDSDDSGSSDWTSSSGSESEPEEDEGQDDDDDGDSAPEVASSRREGPERVPPPPREAKKPICRHFARTGQCNRGDKCKFLHDMRERGTKAKAVEKKGRKGLFQALLDRQKEEEDRRAMEAIRWLGENGLLSTVNGAPYTTAGA